MKMERRTAIRNITNRIVFRLPESIQNKVIARRVKMDMKILSEMTEVEELTCAIRNYIDAKKDSKFYGIKMSDLGYTPDMVDKFEAKLKEHGISTDVSPAIAAAGLVATQKAKETAKVLPSDYRKINVKLQRRLVEQLNKLPYGKARNRLIQKIEMMDNELLNKLYWDMPELFQVYWDYESDFINDGVFNDENDGLHGYGDLIDEYEKRFGAL